MTNPTPVIFIHGMWLHSTSWTKWIDRFEKAGYAPVAPGWPGDSDSVAGTRANAVPVGGRGIQEITDHYAEIIRDLPERPIIVGHSVGGLVAQKLLAAGLAIAAVAIDPAPIKGVTKLPFAQVRSAIPVVTKKKNKEGAVSLTARQFRYSFGNAITKDESLALFNQWSIPAPGKPIFEITAAKKDPNSPSLVDTRGSARGPLLVIGGEKDHTIPEVVTRQVAELYNDSTSSTTYKEFLGRGHSLTIDTGWSEVADYSLQWLKVNTLTPNTAG